MSTDSLVSQTPESMHDFSQVVANFVPRRKSVDAVGTWHAKITSPLSSLTVCSALCSDTEQLNKWFNALATDLSQPGIKRGFGALPSHMRAAVFYTAVCSCGYKFDPNMSSSGHPFTPILLEILDQVMPACNIHDREFSPNAAHVNWYQNGFVITLLHYLYYLD